eukprot:g7078.t1
MFGGSYGSKSFSLSPPSPVSNTNPNHDHEVPQVSPDGISSIHFSPTSNLMTATSWDGTIRIWEISSPMSGAYFGGSSNRSPQINPKAIQEQQEPILCSAFHRDGNGVFFGGVDGQAKYWDFSANQVQQVAQHEQGVKSCFFLKDHGYLVTGSWDQKVCYWDGRSPNPIHVQLVNERVFAMDAKGNTIVVTTGNRKVKVFDLRNPSQAKVDIDSPLKWQTKCVACFNDEKGLLIGSLEGRVGVHHFESNMTTKNFTFKCHRQGDARSSQEVYTINAIEVHPNYGTFVTCGSDGTFHIWDKESKRRLKAMERCNDSISCASFNADGSYFAYAVSYDWRFGVEYYNPDTMKSRILIHMVDDNEVKPQLSGLGNRRR